MSKKAAEFVSNLSKDPAKRDKFMQNPDAVMDEHDLSDEDKAVLRTKDSDKIKSYLGDNSPPGCLVLP